MKRTFRKYPSSYVKATYIQSSDSDSSHLDSRDMYYSIVSYIKDDVTKYIDHSVFTFTITDLDQLDFLKNFAWEVTNTIANIYLNNISKDEWHYYLDAYISEIHEERPNMHPDYPNRLSDTFYDFISKELAKINNYFN